MSFNKNEAQGTPGTQTPAYSAPRNEVKKPEAPVTRASAPVRQEVKKPDVSKIARVTCDLCNIRTAPSSTAEILKTAPKGAEFKFLTNQNGYAKVVVDNKSAFIRQDLVEVFDNPKFAENEQAKKVESER